jgi:hypothetical protein
MTWKAKYDPVFNRAVLSKSSEPIDIMTIPAGKSRWIFLYPKSDYTLPDLPDHFHTGIIPALNSPEKLTAAIMVSLHAETPFYMDNKRTKPHSSMLKTTIIKN